MQIKFWQKRRAALATLLLLGGPACTIAAGGADGQPSEREGAAVDSRLGRDDSSPGKSEGRTGAAPDEETVGSTAQALAENQQLNVPVDRRTFGGNIVEFDHYYTVGELCSPGYERVNDPTVTKLSGFGACNFVAWESPTDINDCRAKIHAHTNAFWGGVECETSVYEKLAPRANGCCSSHPSAGCDEPTTMACVCAKDSFCCTSHWDAICVAEVTRFGCGVCLN